MVRLHAALAGMDIPIKTVPSLKMHMVCFVDAFATCAVSQSIPNFVHACH